MCFSASSFLPIASALAQCKGARKTVRLGRCPPPSARLLRERSAEHLIDLAHRRRGSGRRAAARARLLRVCSARRTEMPRGVLYIVRIYSPVRFELPAAIAVAACIVERDAALPQLRRLVRNQLGGLVERHRGCPTRPSANSSTARSSKLAVPAPNKTGQSRHPEPALEP